MAAIQERNALYMVLIEKVSRFLLEIHYWPLVSMLGVDDLGTMQRYRLDLDRMT